MVTRMTGLTRKIILLSVFMLLAVSALFAVGGKENGNSTLKDRSVYGIVGTKNEAYTRSSTYVKEWLNNYYDIAPLSNDVNANEFEAALSTMCAIPSEKVSSVLGIDKENWSAVEAVKACIKAAGLNELALTYSEEKAYEKLYFYGLEKYLKQDANYIACAIDSGLVSIDDLSVDNSKKSIPDSFAYSALMGVATISGKGPLYLGYSNEFDILGKVSNRFNTLTLLSNNELEKIGANLVVAKTITGYNLKKTSLDAKFLPSLTLRYGHSNKVHAKQLIALLNSENIKAKIQIEPKTSIYEYLIEWGNPPEPTDTYRVEKVNSNLLLAFDTEYDLVLEFATKEELLKFDSVLLKYGKKNDDNQKEGSTEKLIAGAWWQPLYSASFNPDSASYTEVVDNVLYSKDGQYSLHTFTTVEASPSVLEKLTKSSTGSTSNETKFVNNAFYRYLTGTDHQ